MHGGCGDRVGAVPDHPRRHAPPALGRRTLGAGLVLGIAAVSGCDADRGGRATAPGVSAAAGADPDAALVDRVTGQLTELLAFVTGVEARFPSLGPRLRPWRELHTAHLQALGASAPPTGGDSGAAGDTAGLHSPAAAWRELTRREQVGRRRLADAAVAAASGSLARVLASMSAGVAQRLAAGTPQGKATPA